MVNEDRIEEKLAGLEKQLKSLREKQSIPLEEYERDGDLQAIVERRLQNSIQICIDVGMHIVTEEGPRKAETYGDVFKILEGMKVLDSDLSDSLKEKAGFRNVLTHDYADIINERVYNHLQDLETFEKFAEQISDRFL